MSANDPKQTFMIGLFRRSYSHHLIVPGTAAHDPASHSGTRPPHQNLQDGAIPPFFGANFAAKLLGGIQLVGGGEP